MSVHLRTIFLRSRNSNGGVLFAMQKCGISTDIVIKHRNHLFDEEKRRQKEQIGRIEKIEVRYLGLPKSDTLLMNKNISTPFNCAQHLGESIMRMSALAIVNGEMWDMHRPLEESCTLELVNFRSKSTFAVNEAYWRTCSFIVGGILERTFKEDAGFCLHSFPRPSVKSGSFTSDFALKEPNWQPKPYDLKTIGVEMKNFVKANDKIERLQVNHDVALEMFKDNPLKREQLPSISNRNNGIITVYRAGDHIDISKGPMIASTRFIERIKISSVHKIFKDESDLYRIQGISLPQGFTISAYAFNLLNDRAKKLNTIGLTSEVDHKNTDADDKEDMLQQRI